jgi:RHS repeat-associated protein
LGSDSNFPRGANRSQNPIGGSNSNRLTAVETQGSDVDLEGTFDQPNLAQSASQVLKVDAGSNRLLGFTQTITRMQGGQPVATTSSNVNYAVDANGSMTSDGLRRFEYDDTGRLAEVQVWKDGEAARVRYLHNALGQRVFKSEPEAEQTLPKENELGVGFVNWLRKNFGWMFQKGNGARTSVGTAFVQGDGEIPGWALLGEYDNGSAAGKGRGEYVWLPVEGGNAVMVGMYRNGKLYAVHTDHLGTPRLISDGSKATVWQWPYGGFGSNTPTGVLATTATGRLVATNKPVEFNHRFPGQYYDAESGLFQNWHRDYLALHGRYIDFDPTGLADGFNGYLYAGARPLTSVDPWGLAALEIPLPSIPLPNWISVPSGRILGSVGAILSLAGDTPREGGCKCSPATPENIRAVLNSAVGWTTLQPTVSASHVQNLVYALSSGAALPPVKADGSTIVDGNHTFIATILCRKALSLQVWTAPLSKKSIPVQDLQIMP